MASKTRRNFTDEFKAETVALLEGSGRPLSQVAQELGIEQSVLRAWRRKLRPPAAQSPRPPAFAGNGHAAVVPAVTLIRLKSAVCVASWSACRRSGTF
jgi:transposase